jgi:hypothetical protein
VANDEALSPVHFAVLLDRVNTLEVLADYDKDQLKIKLFQLYQGDRNKSAGLIHFAIMNGSFNSVHFLLDKTPECVDEICFLNYQKIDILGASVVHMVCDRLNEIDSDENTGLEPEVAASQKASLRKILRLFLERCSANVLITNESGSVLTSLIKIRNVKDINYIYKV